MRGFSGDPNVEPDLDAIDAYLAKRGSGRGRPSRSTLGRFHLSHNLLASRFCRDRDPLAS
jgi:hypothetical protein